MDIDRSPSILTYRYRDRYTDMDIDIDIDIDLRYLFVNPFLFLSGK